MRFERAGASGLCSSSQVWVQGEFWDVLGSTVVAPCFWTSCLCLPCRSSPHACKKPLLPICNFTHTYSIFRYLYTVCYMLICIYIYICTHTSIIVNNRYVCSCSWASSMYACALRTDIVNVSASVRSMAHRPHYLHAHSRNQTVSAAAPSSSDHVPKRQPRASQPSEL